MLLQAIETLLQLLLRVAGSMVAARDVVLDDVGVGPPDPDEESG